MNGGVLIDKRMVMMGGQHLAGCLTLCRFPLVGARLANPLPGSTSAGNQGRSSLDSVVAYWVLGKLLGLTKVLHVCVLLEFIMLIGDDLAVYNFHTSNPWTGSCFWYVDVTLSSRDGKRYFLILVMVPIAWGWALAFRNNRGQGFAGLAQNFHLTAQSKDPPTP